MRVIILSLLLSTFLDKSFAFDWQGHRGARGLVPENTIEAMRKALDYPITTLELDVVVAKDGMVIVSHEPWVSPEICSGPGVDPAKPRALNIYKLTAQELATFDCGSKPHPRFPQQQKLVARKPTLRELLETTEALISQRSLRIRYNVEIKSTVEDERAGYQPDVGTFTEAVVKELTSRLPSERFSIQSFDWRVLRYLNKAHPRIETVALIEGPFEAAAVLRQLGFAPSVFSPYFKFLSKKDVAFFQAKKVKVIPWTVNEVSDMEALRKLGVDGLITDYPDRIRAVKSSP